MTELSTTDAQIEAPPDEHDQHRDDADDAPSTADSEDGGFDPRSETIRRYLAWGGLAVCSLVAVFALIQFYGSVTDAIDLWIDPKYQPLLHASFNLAVLLTALIGVSLLVRELSDRS